EGVGTCERQPAHVADVEQPGGGPDGLVLVGDARVLHGHVPAGEIDHAGAVGGVPVVQRRASSRHGIPFAASTRAGEEGSVWNGGKLGKTDCRQVIVRALCPESKRVCSPRPESLPYPKSPHAPPSLAIFLPRKVAA